MVGINMWRRIRLKIGSEKGISLIETVIALALLAIIAIAFLGGLGTASQTLRLADERATAKTLAEKVMEDVKSQDFAVTYSVAPIPAEYVGYTAQIDAQVLHDTNIQRIVVTIEHHSEEILFLEGYKVNR